METITETVHRIIRDELIEPRDNITNKTTLESFEFDSLDMATLSLAFEDAFNVDVFDSDVAKWVTVGDIVSFFEEELSVNVFPALKDGDFSSGAKLPTEIFGTSLKT